MATNQVIIQHTLKWIEQVVIGLNFCPFAAREVNRGTIHYEVYFECSVSVALQKVFEVFLLLDQSSDVETALLIFPDQFTSFDDYLQFFEMAETLLVNGGYEGTYQLASFHPEYQFGGTEKNDASNYTNRSPYPMVHVLREESVSRAVDSHPAVDSIPEKNMEVANEKGIEEMKRLWNACKAV